jgi:hypothetical protein
VSTQHVIVASTTNTPPEWWGGADGFQPSKTDIRPGESLQDLIDDVCDSGRLELFTVSNRDGWDHWGSDAPTPAETPAETVTDAPMDAEDMTPTVDMTPDAPTASRVKKPRAKKANADG